MFGDSDRDRAEYLAFQESISTHTVGLLLDDRRSVGTGVLVQYRDQRAIVTAAHNLNGVQPHEIAFFFKPAGTIQVGSMQELAAARPMRVVAGDTLKLDPTPLRDAANDVAVLRIQPSEEIPEPAALYDATTLTEIAIGDGTSMLFLGFPVNNSIRAASGRKIVGAAAEHTRYDSSLVARTTLPAQFNPEAQLLLEYTLHEDGIDPPGFSGAGVWCNRNVSSATWVPSPVLVGIQTGYFRRSRVIQVTRVGPVLVLLEQL